MGGVVAEMPREFREQMTRLMGLKFAPSDLTTHWEALRELPATVLEAAVTRAQRTRAEFPTPVELRQDADLVAHLVRPCEDVDGRIIEDLPEPVVLGTLPTGKPITQTRVWRYYDERCSDTGWASWWCGPEGHRECKPWWPVQACERHGEHAPHEWTAKCACWESNPALVRQRDRTRKYAEAAKSKRAA